MTGTLVPPWFERYHVTQTEMSVVSIVWGISIGCSLFCAATAISQSLQTWARSRRITAYVIMIWTELAASTVIGVISWLYMRNTIKPSFEFFFFVLVLWVIQIQVLLQIIINRIGLLHTDGRKIHRLKWLVAAYVGLINISVFCIWLPAQLQRSATYVRINHVWDRVEKVLFMLIDAGLNVYFMWLVRRNLIANGLDKYKTLFWTNAALDAISVFLDLAIILSMSFRNPFIYVQFHPLAYTAKLAIEMSLANLIAKVARASSAHRMLDDLPASSSYDMPRRTRLSAARDVLAAGGAPPPVTSEITGRSGRRSGGEGADEGEMLDGITKTVAMEVKSERTRSGAPRAGAGEVAERSDSLDSAASLARGDREWLRREGVAEMRKAYIP